MGLGITFQDRRNFPWDKHRKKSLLEPPLQGEPDTRPLSVYTESEAEFYYDQDEETRAAWNAYVRNQADRWNEANSYDRQVHLYARWAPDVGLRAFVEAYRVEREQQRTSIVEMARSAVRGLLKR